MNIKEPYIPAGDALKKLDEAAFAFEASAAMRSLIAKIQDLPSERGELPNVERTKYSAEEVIRGLISDKMTNITDSLRINLYVVPRLGSSQSLSYEMILSQDSDFLSRWNISSKPTDCDDLEDTIKMLTCFQEIDTACRALEGEFREILGLAAIFHQNDKKDKPRPDNRLSVSRRTSRTGY